ncbi:phosphoglycerate mutase-like protein [Wolfiporia cocos MD-104 SS10]|uniref:Phosphoglycerate mutase-like protein n=1 Tax=Wolfiporia cocos (strain MD-104) TaxID=742152 RepID=A0A2H3JMJ2_WOLCO|nr:phosphoglycerate mutase-like protein [Wolfiporia cocos MD-104 SS10]
MTSTPTVTFTFIRHGESTDNLKSVWAGWKDAPLSNHGMNQAKALGVSLSNTRVTAIHASPLKRALWTAQAVRNAQKEPQPPLTTSLLLREQYWGIAEGKPWIMQMEPGISLEEHYAKGVYPVLSGRADKFPEGESLDDLAQRAAQAIDELAMPYVWQAARAGESGLNIAIVSHGLCISELIPALLVKDASGAHPGHKYKGLLNTAWTRVTVTVKGAKPGEVLDFLDSQPPPLQVQVTDFNRHEHLDQIARQKGGIGSAEFDPKQQDIRAFFGGAAVSMRDTEEGRSESNARDEVNVDL